MLRIYKSFIKTKKIKIETATILILLFGVCGSCSPAGKMDWNKTDKNGVAEKSSISFYKGKLDDATLKVDIEKLAQVIDGFGGAFNEAGWEALSYITEEEREAVLKELFSKEGGAKLEICRVPIGSSDYALKRYSHNEVAGDYAMNNFSIERDYKYLLPYIKAALKFNPDMKFFASAWSPPTWMKDNKGFNSGKMIDDPKNYEAYALYLAKFVKAYHAEGINVFEVAVQNEPKVLTPYPSCDWDPEQFFTFVKYHLGPTFKRLKVPAGIMLGTFNYGNEFNTFIRPLLNDKEIFDYITTIGFQWSGVDALYDTREKFPSKKIMQTETECGNWSWAGKWNTEIPDFFYDRNKPQNDYSYAVYTFNRMLEYFRYGANSYLLWNIILDEKGLNNNKSIPWPQNAAIVIDKNKKKVIYTPMYHAFTHFSSYIQKNAFYLPCESRESFAASFMNPDGSIVIVLQNSKSKDEEVSVQLGEVYFNETIPANTFNTFVVPAGALVLE